MPFRQRGFLLCIDSVPSLPARGLFFPRVWVPRLLFGDVQYEGGRRMPMASFLCGHPVAVGTVLDGGKIKATYKKPNGEANGGRMMAWTESVDAIREELGLNQSLGKQYVDYLNDLVPLFLMPRVGLRGPRNLG